MSSRISLKASQINSTNSILHLASPMTFEASATLSAGSGQIDLGAITLNEGVTLTVGNSSQSGVLNLSSVTGQVGASAVSNLTLYSSGAVNVSGNIASKIGNLILTNSAGATFSGAVGSSGDFVTAITLTATTGTVKFLGVLYATSLSNPASSFDLQLYGSTTRVVNFVTLNTTGTVYFGNLTRVFVGCVCT
ncbi:MAG: hypothetical protein JZU63_00200, partial [Rhodoferax sp.]|nr:hypothetical protein [Rhodoferax sp.]